MLFTAYAIVRTVPSANRPNRKKKKHKKPKQRGNKPQTKTHKGSEAGRGSQRTNKEEGEGRRRRPAATDREGAREGSKDRREEAARAK